MGDWLREQWGRRHWGLNLILLFSAYMAFFYVPWDFLVKPAAIDEEVWFGVRFHGTWAKLLEIPHLAVYAGIMVGLWKQRPWARFLLAAYLAQMTIANVVWPLLYVEGLSRFPMALAAGGVFGALAAWVWRNEALFQARRPAFLDRYGEWALVTGASAGIGAEFAQALAREGVSLVLVARREEKLRKLARELESRHGVKTRTIACDLADAEQRRELVSATADLEIGALVNSAGFGYAGRFDKQDPERLVRMVRLHCEAPVALTGAYLPAMKERGRGAVIFVGSVSGSQPLPLHAVYSATKSFDNFLGEALWGELRGTGIDVLSLLPGSTVSEFHELAGELPHPGEPVADVVANALDALGRVPSVISGQVNWIRANAAARLLPRSVLALTARGVIERQTPEQMR